jgi:hypothetical protein
MEPLAYRLQKLEDCCFHVPLLVVEKLPRIARARLLMERLHVDLNQPVSAETAFFFAGAATFRHSPPLLTKRYLR